MEEERGIEHAVTSQAWLRRTLEEIVVQIRRLLDVTGVSFLVVDWDERQIRPAASWFASDAVRDAFGPVLSRPYEPRRAGITEAAIEGGRPVLIERIEDWPGSEGLHERLVERLEPGAAERLWEWYRTSSFLSCPVRTGEGRVLGVLATARSLPQPAFSAEDLRVIEVFAGLAALALERSELLDREERRARDEELLNRASQEVSRSLDVDEVSRAIVAQAAAVSGAEVARLMRIEPGAATLHEVACVGCTGSPRARHRVGEGEIGRAAQSGEATFAERDACVPIVLGPRVFGVLSLSAGAGGFSEGAPDRLVSLALVAAGALANALDYERERRVAHALTAGFVPGRPPTLEDHEIGFLYEPAGQQAGGGDVFGIWTLPGGGLGLLVGDVSGKGLEVAATAAMVRFFAEARTFDCPRPAEVLAQTNAILLGRMPEELFVPAFLGVIEGHRLRWCNAGHPPALLLRRGGGVEALGTTGLPLGIEAGAAYQERELELVPGDVLVAATDGLWEARQDGVQFGDARLHELLGEHGLALAPQELVGLLREEVERWAPRLHDDLVILAVRVLR
jgi:GAF domain-containing protein